MTHRLPEVYPQLACGHERFEVVGGGPVRLGATIDCSERAGNQEVHHRYVVEVLTPARHLYYASKPTETRIHLKDRVIADEADTHVYYDLTDLGGATEVTLTIIIQLRKRLKQWLALATGSQGLWSRHAREELDMLRALLEAG